MQNIILTRITLKDIDAYVALEKSVSGAKTYSGVTTEKEAIEELGNKNTVAYFIKKDGEIVGSIEYEIKNKDEAYISGLVVSPRFQGQGFGYAALEQLMSGELRDIPRVDLVTHPRNSRAIRLYLSLGFVIESWKDNYYGDGEPRIVMARVK